MPSMDPIEAAVELARRHRLEGVAPVVLKDGSNLIVHLAPHPVVVRVATFTAWVRKDPLPCLEREAALGRALAAADAPVAPPSRLIPPGPHDVAGWAMTAWQLVDHQPGVVPATVDALAALDRLHVAMAGIDVDLPFLGPVLGDLDLAWDRAAEVGLLDGGGIAERRRRRDGLVDTLEGAAPSVQPIHGDAFPRNALVGTDGTIVWIDLEDACLGPTAWDHAVMIRQGRDPSIEPSLRARDGDPAIDAALALRELQLEAWMLLHDARAAGRLPVPPSYG